MKQVTFLDILCDVDTSQVYQNGRKAIILTDAVEGDGVAYATLNSPEVLLLPEQVIIKNYSENQGILDVLIKANIISEPVNYVRLSPWITAPICNLITEEYEQALLDN